jgi:hypothetical protein
MQPLTNSKKENPRKRTQDTTQEYKKKQRKDKDKMSFTESKTHELEAANEKYAAQFTKGDLAMPPSRYPLLSHRSSFFFLKKDKDPNFFCAAKSQSSHAWMHVLVSSLSIKFKKPHGG